MRQRSFWTVAFAVISFSFLSHAQTQFEANETAQHAYQKADGELNAVYQKILVEYKSDTSFVKACRAAQRAWIKFRDAQLAMKFPDEGSNYYGSMLPMCESLYLEELTRERIETLKEWLVGVLEGSCTGSIKVRSEIK